MKSTTWSLNKQRTMKDIPLSRQFQWVFSQIFHSAPKSFGCVREISTWLLLQRGKNNQICNSNIMVDGGRNIKDIFEDYFLFRSDSAMPSFVTSCVFASPSPPIRLTWWYVPQNHRVLPTLCWLVHNVPETSSSMQRRTCASHSKLNSSSPSQGPW